MQRQPLALLVLCLLHHLRRPRIEPAGRPDQVVRVLGQGVPTCASRIPQPCQKKEPPDMITCAIRQYAHQRYLDAIIEHLPALLEAAVASGRYPATISIPALADAIDVAVAEHPHWPLRWALVAALAGGAP
jgi:hypothetical protein